MLLLIVLLSYWWCLLIYKYCWFFKFILSKFSFNVLNKYYIISQVCLTSKNHQHANFLYFENFCSFSSNINSLELNLLDIFLVFCFFDNWDRIQLYVFYVDMPFSQYCMIESLDIILERKKNVFTSSRILFSHW